MRFPPGVDPDSAAVGYLSALEGFSVDAIVNGIRRFLRGEVDGVSPKFCPHPPELARIIRDSMPNTDRPRIKGKLYGYRPPRSRIIEKRCTRDWARRLVETGVHPRGSIWCPGSIDDERPDIGDLYAPDAEWKRAVPLVPGNDDEPRKEPTNAERARMGFKMSILSAGISHGVVHRVSQANEAGLEELVALGQEWGVPVPEEVWRQIGKAA